MRNILNVDLTNSNCNGVFSSDCGGNCSEILLNISGLELMNPYLYFILQDENIYTTEILEIKNNEIYYELSEDIINKEGKLIVSLKAENYESNAINIATIIYTSEDKVICKYNSTNNAFEYNIMKNVEDGGIVVIDNLESTSATDALSANQGRILNNSIKEFEDSKTVVIDNLESTSATDALSANQGKVINEKIETHYITQTGTDLNNYTENGTYFFTQDSTPENIPIGVNGWVQVFNDGNMWVRQIWHRAGSIGTNDFDMYVRTAYNGSWGTWTKIITGKTYPVGTVLTTATNTNPSETYGGTWELIDKEFSWYKPATNTGWTINSTNTTSASVYWSRSGHTISITGTFVNKVDIEDTTLTIGTLNLSTLGVSRTGQNHWFTGFSDNGSCILMMQFVYNTGELQVVDIVGDPYVSAGRSCNFGFTINIPSTYINDSACNKFYWKKTA